MLTSRCEAAPAARPAPARRATRQRAAIDEALAGLADPVSAQDLHHRLAGAGVHLGLSTVYRRLGDLVAEHRLDALPSPDGGYVYRSCGSRPDHVELTCRACGTVTVVHAPELEAWATGIGSDVGFTGLERTVALSGLCDRCGAG